MDDYSINEASNDSPVEDSSIDILYTYPTVRDGTPQTLQTLHESAVATFEDARTQALQLQYLLEGRVYSTYLEQCQSVAPEFRARGQRLGEALLERVMQAMTADQIDELSYRNGSDTSGVSPVRLDPAPPPSRVVVPGIARDAADHAYLLRMLDRLSSPLLDPFVNGLKEPFVRTVEEITSDMYWNMALVGAAGFAVGTVGGMIIGRFTRGGGGKGT